MNTQSKSNSSASDNSVSYIVYDGECPFCSNYVSLLRIKQAAGPIELVDARSQQHAVVTMLVDKGYDLNEGMAFVMGDDIFYGNECINHLALISTESTLFNKINAFIFRSPLMAKLLYPIMKTGRNITLRLMGRKPLTFQ